MAEFRTRDPNRAFSRDEVEAFLGGSENPYLEPLRGKETELRAWLDREEGTEGSKGSNGADAALELGGEE